MNGDPWRARSAIEPINGRQGAVPHLGAMPSVGSRAKHLVRGVKPPQGGEAPLRGLKPPQGSEAPWS
jgi:hypothetical protein